jgi:hypothetical protein
VPCRYERGWTVIQGQKCPNVAKIVSALAAKIALSGSVASVFVRRKRRCLMNKTLDWGIPEMMGERWGDEDSLLDYAAERFTRVAT